MLENNKNSGKIKIQNCCEPCIMVSSVSNALYLVHFKNTDSISVIQVSMCQQKVTLVFSITLARYEQSRYPMKQNQVNKKT